MTLPSEQRSKHAPSLISVDEAFQRIAEAIAPIGNEQVALREAQGRVLAEPLVAKLASPRCATSAMDGFAVTDVVGQSRWEMIGQAFPGAPFVGSVGTGEAVRIFTGAPLPAGADRVIIQENIAYDGRIATLKSPYGNARHVRAEGSDFAADAMLLDRGDRLVPRAMVTAAAADRATISVARMPRVSIIATGDELAEPGEASAQPYAIPESVSFGVAALVAQWGGQVVHMARGPDRLDTLQALAAAALERSDLVVVTGGASVGDRDFAKSMFASSGLELIFAKVAMKPGKPVWLGRAAGKVVLGLPGNPTSAMVAARLFLVAVLGAMLGQRWPEPLGWRNLPLGEAIEPTGDRDTFLRARWCDDGLRPVANQDSGAQRALVEADWLIHCLAGQGAMPRGTMVSALPF